MEFLEVLLYRYSPLEPSAVLSLRVILVIGLAVVEPLQLLRQLSFSGVVCRLAARRFHISNLDASLLALGSVSPNSTASGLLARCS